MASIGKEGNGYRILFVAPDGRRKTVRLGKVSRRQAEATKVKIEALLASIVTGHAPDEEVSNWLAKRDGVLVVRMAAVGLIPRREKATLKPYLDTYIKARCDVKGGTVRTYEQARDSLVAYFGENRPLRDITEGDAEDWRRYLKTEEYAEATIGRRIKHAKCFFRSAVRKRLIPSNPFAVVKGGTQENPSRLRFVTREESRLVLDACPDAECRLLFALARFGGLRIPSEAQGLRWVDVDWEHNRFTVHSPKTEHHRGGESRIVPLFPELRPYFEEVFDPESVYVLPGLRGRGPAVNLRTRLERIILRAGLKPWPRLWQNLRSTRETELADRFPAHVVCRWIGNSEPVAQKHYLQVTDEHYHLAVAEQTGTESGTLPAQNPAQQPSVKSRVDSQKHGKDAELCGVSADMQPSIIGPEGFEPPTKGL